MARFLLLDVFHEGHSLERAQTRANSDCPQIGDDGLAETGEGQVARVITRVEAVHIPGFGEKLPRPGRIVRDGGSRPDELDAWPEGDEPVRAGADRRLLEALLTDALHVALGDDPGGARRRGAEEGHEVGPRLF